VAVVGAGPGGLTAAMILAHRGLDVTVYEQKDYVGGRNSTLRLGDYVFDLGPTFLMMKFILDEVFDEAGKVSSDYLEFVELDPMYALSFKDYVINPTTDRDRMKAEIAKCFKGQEQNLDKFMAREKVRFDKMLPCLQKDYSTFSSMFCGPLLKALPHLSLHKTLFRVLGDYFDPAELRLSFTFQSKYLGMSPWECPAAFAILSYIEHAFGVYHTTGGLSRISECMAEVVEENGGAVRLAAPVTKLVVEGGTATGLELQNGERVDADAVIINADFAHAMSKIVPPEARRKYTESRLQSMKYSCSTFMLYLGLDKLYDDMPHHTIVFAEDYRRNVEDIFKRKLLSQDTSVYVRNASVTDKTLAPEGHSAVYVLVPVANLTADIDWEKESDGFKEAVLTQIAERTSMTDVREHIVEEKVVTPLDWRDEYSVYSGATFNLAHTLGQMLYLRPRNRFEEFRNCYIVGGGTHPGSGIPTILESGRIAANLVCRDSDVPFISKNVMV